jgi:hypothetical protein
MIGKGSLEGGKISFRILSEEEQKKKKKRNEYCNNA